MLEVSSQLGNLIVSFDQVLVVQVSVGSDSFVEGLLLLKLTFKLNDFFLELSDHVSLELDLFNHLHQVGVGLGSLKRELVSVLLKSIGLLDQLSDVLLLGSSLLSE